MTLPGRHSLFWKLAALLIGFSLLVITLSWSWGKRVEGHTSYLSAEARAVLQGYAREAEVAAREGEGAVQAFLQRLRQREPGWSIVLDANLQPLHGQVLDPVRRQRLTFMRQVDWPLSKRASQLSLIDLPFADADGHLVMQLPERFRPRQYRAALHLLARYLIPVLATLLFCVALYRVLAAPLVQLREQANALHADDLQGRVGTPVSARRDELGDLGRAFDHMAERLQGTVELQRQLLRDLSHELRTPLSRLRVAGEAEMEGDELRRRLDVEVSAMQRLVDSTLELAWMDTERPRFACTAVNVAQLWAMLAEDASFETGWPLERLVCRLPDDCVVDANLNALARALENILRNAIRHSPPAGQVSLSGCREGAHWHFWISDQGPGVATAELQALFLPFKRLDGGQPGGFGLGLSIASSAVLGMGGSIWADHARPGLSIHVRLPVAASV